VTISLPTESSDNYPKSPALKTRTLVINRKAGDIVPWIKNALPFVSNDDLRPSMTGVCFMKHEGKVVVVATDAHRLYRRSLFDHALEMGLENNVIVPRKPSRVMCELFKKPEDMLLILADDTHLSVVNDDYFIITRLVDARYPDWTKVWPEENPYSFFAKRKQLKAMITLALPYSNMSTRQLVLEVAENSLIGATQDVDWQFDFSYKMPIYNTNIDPAVNEIAFNGNLLMQAITVTKDDLVKIEFSSSTKATIIDNDILLMPLLLNK
jgi:DNA polymerase-3 subunit beta